MEATCAGNERGTKARSRTFVVMDGVVWAPRCHCGRRLTTIFCYSETLKSERMTERERERCHDIGRRLDGWFLLLSYSFL